MSLLDEIDLIEDRLARLDMVRAAEIARRCGVARWTVSRWKCRSRWDGTRWIEIGALPVPHLTVACVEYWSWPLLQLWDPERFGATLNSGEVA